MTATCLESTVNFDAIVKQYKGLIRSIGRAYRIEHDDLEDLVQEVFMKLWCHMDKLRDVEKLRSWISVVTRNHCNNGFHSRKREKDFLNRLESQSELFFSNPCNLHSEEHELRQDLDTQLEQLHRCLYEHPHEQRRTIADLFYRHDCSIAEIAQICAMNSNTVLSHLRRFRLSVSTSLQTEQVTHAASRETALSERQADVSKAQKTARRPSYSRPKQRASASA